ncbi:MAG TPA: hypothetical protein VK970_10610, partial [Candidatus Methylacidiphilales bacterium]|nr:hypothetical protein [Candidatus Methylacidiphilales bacterium]
MDFIVSIALEVAGEILAPAGVEAAATLFTATRECTREHTHWRFVCCTSCGEDYVYEQAIRVTGAASDPFLLNGDKAVKTAERRASAALSCNVDELSDVKSAVYCPACGSYEPEHCEEAADAVGDEKMYRVMYACVAMIFAVLILLALWIACIASGVHFFGLNDNFVLSHGAFDLTIILIAAICVPFFLSPIIKSRYTPRDINSPERKAERLASSNRYALRRTDFAELASA